MKKILLFLFSLLISFNSYGLLEKTVCVETDSQDRSGFIYLPNTTKPFTGNNLCEYQNGQYRSKGKIEDGKRDGIWTEWYKNGKIRLEGNYKDGRQHGKWTFRNENGQIKEEGNFKDGLRIIIDAEPEVNNSGSNNSGSLIVSGYKVVSEKIGNVQILSGGVLVLNGIAKDIYVEKGGELRLSGIANFIGNKGGRVGVSGVVTKILAESGYTEIAGIVNSISGNGEIRIKKGSFVNGREYKKEVWLNRK